MISDIESMSYDWGSSWVYEQILTFHVRFARATPENALRFGGRPKQTSSNSFHPSIAPTLRSLVLNPEDFISETGHCLAVSVILTILSAGCNAKLSTLRTSETKYRKLHSPGYLTSPSCSPANEKAASCGVDQ